MGTPRRQNVILQHPKPTTPPSACSHAEASARRCTVLKHTTLQRCVGRAHPSGWEHPDGRPLSFSTHKPTTPPSACSHAEAWARRCTVLKHTTLQRCVGRAHPSGWEHHDGRTLSSAPTNRLLRPRFVPTLKRRSEERRVGKECQTRYI